MVPNKYKLQALLHDAAEAYICDVPTPLKHMLGPSYTAIERVMAKAIGERFNVELVKLELCVKQADRALVIAERDYLQDNPQNWGEDFENTVVYPHFMRLYVTPDIAKRAFLSAFNKYTELPKEDEWNSKPLTKSHA